MCSSVSILICIGVVSIVIVILCHVMIKIYKYV